jgi:hypothetical protein
MYVLHGFKTFIESWTAQQSKSSSATKSIIQSTPNSRKIHASHKFLDPIQNCASESSSLLETEYLGALVYQ